MANPLLAGLLVSLWSLSYCQLSRDPHKLLNWCIASKYHKDVPGPEPQLHGECAPWRSKSCCHTNTTVDLHYGQLYNFNFDHCQPLSSRCRSFFRKDHCFFECDPNLGPWVTRVEMKTRKERFYGVPLCSSDCDAWFEACRYDYTCADNWIRGGFLWKNGENHCYSTNPCRTFAEMFKTSKNFCENVWDESWKYVDEATTPCMRIVFNENSTNPNTEVASLRIQQILGNSANSALYYNHLYLLLAAVTVALWCQ